MDKKELYKQVDHKRWLMNNGMIDDTIKNDLFFYGSISHPNVKALEFSVDIENKTVNYDVYLQKQDFNIVKKFLKLSKSSSLFGLWRFKRMLKKHGNMNPGAHVDLAIKDFAGPNWKATATIKNFSEYNDSPYEYEDKVGEFGPGSEAAPEPN